MKVLLVNFVYNWGSTGYICRDLYNQLNSGGVEVVVAAGFDWGKPRSGMFTFCTRFERLFYVWMNKLGIVSKFDGSPIATWRLIRFIKNQNPDIVHMHNLNCQVCNMYKVLKWLGENNIKTVITHHAEILYTGNCNYSYECNGWMETQCRNCSHKEWATGSKRGDTHSLWLRMSKTFSYFKTDNVIFTAVSPWVEGRAKQCSYLSQFRCQTIMNGIDTTVFHRRTVGMDNIKQRLNEYNKSYLLYVSANFDPLNKEDIKGGYEIVELAKIMPENQFLIVSTAVANTEILPPNVLIWGKAKSQDELAELYSFASLTVLTSKKETFSMICAESLCCGTPIVGFEAGGPESISLKDYSSFVKNGDFQALRKEVNKCLLKEYNRIEISKYACGFYSKERMTDGYAAIYRKLFNKNIINDSTEC